MEYYRTCPICGAHLDPGEKCDCQEPDELADRVAQARACGISYGQLMRIVELGAAIPAIRPVEWPSGSVHVGE